MAVLRDPLGVSGVVLDGRYLVERAVGEGGAAFVYKGQHTQAGVNVAIKFLHSLAQVPEAERPAVFEELRREGNLISDLSTRTSAIVQSRDLGVLQRPGQAPFPYLVLEWLEGRTLDEVLVSETNAGKPPRALPEAIQLLEPIAGAVGIAHERGVVHRDLKPENIFVIEGATGPGSRIKLLDFGIAKVMQRRLTGLHQTGTAPTAFTPHYGAPEQFSRTYGETGPWTDVYAIALVVIEVMQGGRRAYKGDDYMELARQACDEERRPTPRLLGHKVGDAVESVFGRALAVNPLHRYGSMAEFWSALLAAMNPTTAGFPLAGPSAAAAQRSGQPSGGYAPAPGAAGFASGPQSAATGAPSITSQPGGAAKGGGSKIVTFALIGGAILIVGAAVTAGLKLSKKTESTASALASAGPAASDAGSSKVATSPTVDAAGTASAAAAGLCPAGAMAIPGGRFNMGSSDPALKDDGPRHAVNVDSFCLDRTEVPASAYATCVGAKACSAIDLAALPSGGEGCTSKADDTASHPINCVDWDQAAAYCQWKGMRLPTEAELELAARGSSNTELPWTGDDVGRANLEGKDDFAKTAPVASFPSGASKEGVHDLIGNVAEWASDYFGPYSGAELVNPKGPTAGAQRVVRGGSWAGLSAIAPGPKPSKLTATHREAAAPTTKNAQIGFRCAQNLSR